MFNTANPVIAELWRGDGIESVHRGAWVLVDTSGTVIDGRGDPAQLVYARSSTKSIQALPLVEEAGDLLSITDAEVAIAIASHTGEARHIEATRSLLARGGNTEEHLLCGRELPAESSIDTAPRQIAHICSGKHAGFLAAAVALGDDPACYLDPTSAVQQRVHEAIVAMTGADANLVTTSIDGCSAPTYRLPLASLATGLARMANSEHLAAKRAAACQRIIRAASAHPELVGGTSEPRFDTDVLAASSGRLFAKDGTEGIQTIGIVGEGYGFAAKIDDGSARSLSRLTLAVLSALDLLNSAEGVQLDRWRDPTRTNKAGLDIGLHVVPADAVPTH
jgi:L-asparaginase II